MKNLFRGLLVALAMLAPLTMFVSATYAATQQTVTLSWTNPTTRTDGTAFAASEIAGYRIYWTVDGGAGQTRDLTGAAATATLPLALTPRAKPYVITLAIDVVDAGGLRSALSNTANLTLAVKQASPNSPAAIKVTVVCVESACTATVE